MTLAIRGRGDSHNLEVREYGTANAVLTPNGGRAGIGVGAVAFNAYQRTVGDAHSPLTSEQKGRSETGVIQAMQVRRLTPRECERLQGFPDDYTLIQTGKAKKFVDAVGGNWAGEPKLAADGPRYKALGNSMAVPVMRWIGRRLQIAVELF